MTTPVSSGLDGPDMANEANQSAPECDTTFGTLRFAALAVAAAAAVLMIVLYVPTFKFWYKEWMAKESEYSHGILIPFISGLVIYLKRKELRQIEIKPSQLGWVLILPSLAVAILGYWANAISMAGLMLPTLVGGSVILLFGTRVFAQLLFPIAFLYFMCVVPTFILHALSFKIQYYSTVGATLLLKLTGFGVEREGVVIYMPSVTVQVAEACSGFRLLISLFAFSTLFAYLREGPLWGKLALVASTLPLSLVTNSMRIALVALVGEYWGSDVMQGFHDNYAGLIELVFAFALLWLLSKVVRCRKFNSMLYS